MNTEQKTAIKAGDSLGEWAALAPSLGANFEKAAARVVGVSVAPATLKATVAALMSASPRVYSLVETVGTYEFPHVKTNDKGEIVGVKSTIENVQKLLQLYGATCRYNAMTKRIDIRVPGISFKADNGSNSAIAEIKSLCRRVGLPVTELVEYLVAIGDKCVYHPVRDWVDSKAWDGVSRLNDLYATMGVETGHEDFRNTMVRRWLISAVAALFSEKDTDKFELVLVMAGEQGLGKTSWVKRLCPAVDNAVKDGVSLNPDEKDSILQAIKHWLVELGELDGIFRKADIAKLKAFLSRTDDEVRLPYAHMDSRFKRRTVMFGSVNEKNFLTDTTGNRRWLTLGVLSVDYQHDIDMQQLWAELAVLYRAGEQWHLTKVEEDMLNRMNKGHEALQPLDELLTEAFIIEPMLTLVGMDEVPAKRATVRLSATAVVRGLGLPVDKKNTNEMASLLRKKFGEPKRDGRHGMHWVLTPARAANWGAVLKG
ncbi:putative P-loop ATPase [Janthinobacterium sp. CG_23.3]|uniref:VapE domain-containing protein n=1 Tax=Janthinobacterium sp. CG_23.3 TaxID=3349634 RepID=UPI0038D3B35F